MREGGTYIREKGGTLRKVSGTRDKHEPKQAEVHPATADETTDTPSDKPAGKGREE